jgi:uncharacterized RmlC-like cupin family protein
MTAAIRPTGVAVRPGDGYQAKQGTAFLDGISAETAGSRRLCLHLATVPPGVRARAHLHKDHETAMYILSGEAEMWYGDGLREFLSVRAGDLLYIPTGMPHLPQNPSDREPCVVVLARTDPNEQESVVLLPELDGLVLPPNRG